MKSTEVVVTGIGMVTPLGATAGETAEAWREGRRAATAPLPELAGTSLEKAEIAVLPPLDIAARLGGRKAVKFLSAAGALGCVAAREASEGAGLRDRFDLRRVGVYAGTGLAAIDLAEVLGTIEKSVDEKGEFSCRLFGERGLPATNPLLSFRILPNMPPCFVSILEGIKGPSLIFTPWEGQTAAALREAWRAVASGEVDGALAGAADHAAHAAALVFLRQAGYLREAEFPAAGAAYLALERADTARRDGVRIYAELLDVSTVGGEGDVVDPLAARMGRTFAAAPAILLALAALRPQEEVFLRGVDGCDFRAGFRRAS